jgi:hypothetical protein
MLRAARVDLQVATWAHPKVRPRLSENSGVWAPRIVPRRWISETVSGNGGLRVRSSSFAGAGNRSLRQHGVSRPVTVVPSIATLFWIEQKVLPNNEPLRGGGWLPAAEARLDQLG